MTTHTPERAVVLGAGIAGLCAARVLADHVPEVTVVDRDPLGPDAVPRRGTPQARHIHGLLPGGHRVFEEMFPGLTDELVAAGAPLGDLLADSRACFGGHRLRQGPSGLTLLCVSRPTLEAAVRRRVADLPQVTLLGERDIVGLLASPDGDAVVGARVIARADGSAEERLAADVVIDATGRGSRLPGWLADLGYVPPRQERTKVDVGYASRHYRVRAETMGGDLSIVSAPMPGRTRGAGLSLLEGDRCVVTLMGVLGDHPPTDPVGFERFAADLVLPDIHRVITQAEPLDDPVAYRYPMSVRNRYDRLARFPDGLAVLGDAVCTLNPIYGQGMTVAALEARALGAHVRKGLTRAYQRDVARINAVAWSMALGADLAFPQVEGRRTPAVRLLGRYVDRLQAHAEHDARLGGAFLRVMSLIDPPTALFRPSVVARAAAPVPAGR